MCVCILRRVLSLANVTSDIANFARVSKFLHKNLKSTKINNCAPNTGLIKMLNLVAAKFFTLQVYTFKVFVVFHVYPLQKMAVSVALQRKFMALMFVTFITILLYGLYLKSSPVKEFLVPLVDVNNDASSPMEKALSVIDVTSSTTEKTPLSTDDASSPTAATADAAPKDDIPQPLNVSVYLESISKLNAFYGNRFTKMEKEIPLSCQLPAGGTCTLHHSNESALTSDVVFRMIRFIHPNDTVRYHEGQLLAIMNSEAERGEYGLQQLREADIRMDHHPSSEIMLAEVCALPVHKWESSPPPDPTQRKGIAMFMSNCGVKWRTEYLQELFEFIHIDSYGRCFHNVIEPPVLASDKGLQVRANEVAEVSRKYRMVVTFENLIQDDYISEKITAVFGSGAIPVYWGPPQIYSWVPGNHSFIDASKYTPEELAKYLKQVDEEDDLFRHHTTNFDVNKTKEMVDRLCSKKGPHYMCRICQIAQKKLLTRTQQEQQ